MRKENERQLIMNLYLAVETNVAFAHKPSKFIDNLIDEGCGKM